MRDPKSEKTIRDAEDAIDKMFMEAAQSRIGKYSSPLMIDSHLPEDIAQRSVIIKDILEDVKQRIGDYRNRKLPDEEQERKRQLAIDKIEERVNKTFELAKRNDSKATPALAILTHIDKKPFDEIVVSSIIKEKLGF